MSILTPNSFNGGEQNIADISNVGVQQNLQIFIDEYESVFLRELLGVDLANEFLSGLQEDPVPAKWVALRDETDIKSMLKCYVYYWYIRNKVTLTSGTGEVKPSNENSVITNSGEKLCRSWNKMSKNARFFDLSLTEYPNYVRPYWNNFMYWFKGCGISEIYYPINNYGL